MRVTKSSRSMIEAKGRVCPECGSRDLVRDYDTSELVCVSCGLARALLTDYETEFVSVELEG